MSIRMLGIGPKEIIPPDEGGKEGIHGALAALARRAELTYAYPASPDSPAAVSGYSAIGVRPVPVQFTPRESPALMAAATLRLRPYKFAKYATTLAIDRFSAALGPMRFDLVVCFFSHTVRLAEAILRRRGERLPIILRAHNIEYALVQSYASTLRQPVRAAAAVYAAITRREEQALWRRVQAVAMLSEADMDVARESRVPGNFVLVPEGIPLPPRRNAAWPGSAAPLLLVFNPRVPWNITNLQLFFERYWTKARAARRLQDIAVAVTGVGQAQLARLLRVDTAQLEAWNVRALGYVDSLADVLAASLALVSPTFVGAGVRKKVLEAMAHQLPVIATPLDVDRCSYFRPEENILRMDTVEDFASAVERLAARPSLWLALSQAGRAAVERHANWERFGEIFMTEVERLVAASPSGAFRQLSPAGAP